MSRSALEKRVEEPVIIGLATIAGVSLKPQLPLTKTVPFL
jgi:hypothetical protein